VVWTGRRERERRRESSSGSTRNTRGCERQIAALTAHTHTRVGNGDDISGVRDSPSLYTKFGRNRFDEYTTRRAGPLFSLYEKISWTRTRGRLAIHKTLRKRDYECSPPPDDDDAPYYSPYTVCARAKAPRHKTRERYRTDERRHRVRERSVQSVIRRGETVRQALPTTLSCCKGSK
jgi:hypothetical protein